MWLSPRMGRRMLVVPRLRATSTASTRRMAAAGLVCSGSRDLPGDPTASEQIWIPCSSAACLNAAWVLASRRCGLSSVGNVRLTWMPSRPISRASAILRDVAAFPQIPVGHADPDWQRRRSGRSSLCHDGGNRREKRCLCDEFPSIDQHASLHCFRRRRSRLNPGAPIASSSRAAPAPRTLPESACPRRDVPATNGCASSLARQRRTR